MMEHEEEPSAPTPPHDLDAEAAVIAGVLLDPGLVTTFDYLLPEHFWSGAHQRIYQSILELRSEGEKVDHLTVASRLKARQRLAEVGGIAYLTSIVDAVPVLRNVDAYAAVVFERWRLRRIIEMSERAAHGGYGRVADVQAYLDAYTRDVVTLSRNAPTSKLEPQGAVMRRLVDAMAVTASQRAGVQRGVVGMPTGIRSLDLATLGFEPGHKVTVMAERGRGKTSFAIQVGMHVAGWRGRREPLANDRVPVIMFSTEMSREEVAIKQLAFAARVDSKRLQLQMAEPTLTLEEWDRVRDALPLLVQMRMTVNDSGSVTYQDVISLARAASAQSMALDKKPVGMVIVDYVQRLSVPGELRSKREDEQIGAATQAFKNFAKEDGVIVLENAQMNAPDPKVSKDGRPYEGLASQCKRIEKEANIVLCLWRKKRDDLHSYGLTCTKLRGNSEFTLDLEFEPEYGTFVDPAYRGFRSAFEDFV